MRAAAKSLLLASAAVAAATLAVPALADSYFFRSKPVVDPPVPFSFAAAAGQAPGTTVESGATRVKGHGGTTASVSGGEYQVCAAADCSGATWTSAPTADLPSDFHARVRVTAAAFGETATVRLTVGGTAASFEAKTRARDETPDPIEFAPSTAVAGAEARSGIHRLTNHEGVSVAVSGAQSSFRICADATCSTNPEFTSASVTAAKDSYLQLRQQAAPVAGVTGVTTLNYGTLSATWSVTGTAPVPPLVGKLRFTSCGATGPTGPTIAQCQATYGSAGPSITMATQGKQEWTVPEDGYYRITSAGARGGNAGSYLGGSGFTSGVDVLLAAGSKLTIVVGQAGNNGGTWNGGAAGGGGGSAVSSPSGLIVVSGGGGGAGHPVTNGGRYPASAFNGKNATDASVGSTGHAPTHAAGSNGSGAAVCTATGASGGAGWSGASVADSGWATAALPLNAAATGAFQRNSNAGGSGGFGGGGAGAYGGGGGGGYSGGGCGDYNVSPSTGGGAGGSTHAGFFVFKGTNNAEGFVEIERAPNR